jgi:hypothetical protein
MARSALPTFSDRSAELTLVFWGGTTATGQLLGQVQTFSWSDELQTRETYRVGDSSKHVVYTARNPTWELTLYEDDDVEEIALVMGTDKPTSGAWAGTESIALSTSQATTTITVASYDAEATTANLKWIETLAAAKVNTANAGRTANEVNTWTFAGDASTITITPSAG